MSTIVVVNVFAALCWAISAVFWLISARRPQVTLDSMQAEIQNAAYYSRWAAIAACAAAVLQVVSVLMSH